MLGISKSQSVTCVRRVYKLAICIPTFNRSDYLGKLLSSIDFFLAPLRFDILICISDNNSSDATSSVIANFRSETSFDMCTWVNDYNIGGFRNIREVSTGLPAEYLLICGDDDLFHENSVATIANAVNQLDLDSEISVVISSMEITRPLLALQWITLLPFAYPAFIGSTIYRACDWHLYSYSEYPFTLPHLHYIFLQSLSSKVLCICGEYVVKGREIHTWDPSYWFYNANILLDTVEKPWLFVLVSPHLFRINPLRWFWILGSILKQAIGKYIGLLFNADRCSSFRISDSYIKTSSSSVLVRSFSAFLLFKVLKFVVGE